MSLKPKIYQISCAHTEEEILLLSTSVAVAENEHHSVAYFDRVAAFEAQYLLASVKGGAETRCVNAAAIDTTAYRTSPTLNGSSMILHFEHSDAIKICNEIMFVFHPGLSHLPVDWALLVAHVREATTKPGKPGYQSTNQHN